jgi:hypothetical protein
MPTLEEHDHSIFPPKIVITLPTLIRSKHFKILKSTQDFKGGERIWILRIFEEKDRCSGLIGEKCIYALQCI